MKLLFTADLHIKLGQKNVPVEWARNRYSVLFEEIHKLEHKADLLVLGGDIFDRIPSMEELELYFAFIHKISIPTIVYSGNHEALKRNTTFFTHLKNVTKWVNPLVSIVDDFYSADGIDYIPYNKLKEDWPWPTQKHNKILCTHVRGDIAPHVKAEIDLKKFSHWDMVLAGDLHSNTNSQLNILYPGSPLTTSFHRDMVDTGVLLVDSDTLEYEWIKLKVPQLLRQTVKAGDSISGSEYDHTIYDVEGDMSQLENVEDNILIDKKIVKRVTDTTLILDTSMTLENEVDEYLRYILQLNEEDISKVLKELLNHAELLK